MHDRDFGGEQILDLLFRALESETQLLQKQNLAVLFGYVRVQIATRNAILLFWGSFSCLGEGADVDFFSSFKKKKKRHTSGAVTDWRWRSCQCIPEKKPGLVHRAEPSEGCRGTISQWVTTHPCKGLNTRWEGISGTPDVWATLALKQMGACVFSQLASPSF